MAININIPSQFREYNNLAAFPATGSAKVLYVAKNNNKLYRWDTSAYVEVSPQLASSWGSITGNLASQVDLQGALDNKVNTESGKGLSTNDYTTTEKNKLAGIAAGAEVNVNADWNATSGDAQILNKPTIPSAAGLVPYTGATTNVDLGTHTLSAKDLNVNHPSGSGDAATVTKGGSGEALKVVKTSGSGNAMSVTGGVTQLDELHLTTDLADSYIASASTWNAKQEQLVSGTNIKTINGTTVLGSGDITISGGSGVTDVTATSPISSTGGTTPDISITQASAADDGYLSTGDWNMFNNKQDALSSGVNIQTINYTTLLTSGNMNLVAGLSGNSPINTSILTGGIGSISIDQANSTTNGYLSSSNWNTFNGKQNALVSGTNIKTINGSSVLGSGDLTITGGGGGGVHFNTKPISGQYFSGQLTNAGGGASQATSANRMTFIPIIPKTTFTASNFAINVVNTTAGSLCKILIYSDLNGYPSTKLYQSTDLDCSTGGVKTVTASSFVFNANTIYWVGTISNQSGATFTGFAGSSVLPLGVSTPASTMNYFVLNNSFNFLVPPAGPISPTAFSLANNGHIGVFIQAL